MKSIDREQRVTVKEHTCDLCYDDIKVCTKDRGREMRVMDKERGVLLALAFDSICLIAAILSDGFAAVYSAFIGLIASILTVREAYKLGENEEESNSGRRKKM